MKPPVPTYEELAPIDQELARLGWKDTTFEQSFELPLGEAELQHTICAALDNRETWPPGFINPDRVLRLVYLLRAGAHPLTLPRFCYNIPAETLAHILTRLGAECVDKFFDQPWPIPRPDFPLFLRYGYAQGLILALNDPTLSYPIPADEGYLRTWAGVAAHVLVKLDHAVSEWSAITITHPEQLLPRFGEHINQAVELGLPLWEALGHLLTYWSQHNHYDRAQLISMFVGALDTAPGARQRRTLIELLTTHLEVTGEELLPHQAVLAQCLNTAEPTYVNAFAPLLIPVAEDSDLLDLAVGALYVKTLKGKKLVLQALAKREAPTPEVAHQLAPALQTLADSADSQVAKRAADLMGKWGLVVASTSEKPEAGMWRETPPLWKVPRFEVGDLSVESVHAALQQLPRQSEYGDLSVEVFLSRYHALAQTDEKAAARAIKGAGASIRGGLFKTASETHVPPWHSPVFERDVTVVQHAAGMPCILSEPTWVDLRISVSDLVARLEKYRDQGAPVWETDLLLALYRLDVAGADPGLQLGEFTMPIIKMFGETSKRTVGEVVSDYLTDPYPEPDLTPRDGEWAISRIEPPRSLQRMRDQIARAHASLTDPDPAAMPMWGALRWKPTAPPWGLAKIAAQAARMSRPFEPGLAVNMLAVQRSTRRGELVGVREALWQAWERGLIRPGVADAQFFDWKTEANSFKAVAATWEQLAREGLLSVIWPLFDAILTYAFKRSSPTAGANEMAEAMARLAPHVVAAVDAGVADRSALEVPGARAWAGKSGSSKVVKAAKQVEAVLGEPVVKPQQVPPRKEPAGRKVSHISKLWFSNESATAVFSPETTMNVIAGETPSTNKELWTEFQLPNYPDRSFIIPVPTIFNDDVRKNKWQIYERLKTPHRYNLGDYKLMYWDGTKMLLTEPYNTIKPIDPPRPAPQPVIVAALAGLSAGTGDQSYSTHALLRGLIKHRRLGVASCRQAVNTLVESGGVWSPAKAMSIVDHIPEFLPQLWPLITDTIAFAAAQEKKPHWLNRVLDTALEYNEILKYGTDNGYIAPTYWSGLNSIADQPKASAARTKAQELKTALNL